MSAGWIAGVRASGQRGETRRPLPSDEQGAPADNGLVLTWPVESESLVIECALCAKHTETYAAASHAAWCFTGRRDLFFTNLEDPARFCTVTAGTPPL